MLQSVTITEQDESVEPDEGLSLVALRNQFSDFVSVKSAETDEARTSWRYYHSAQWTDEQSAILKKRGQPEITFDRVSRKIDGLVGTVQKLRTDPKAFPRTQAHEQGAELATICVRYVTDSSSWEDIERNQILSAAVPGIGGVELGLEPGDNSDPDITISDLDATTFFYDPRSLRPDFSDARYMGVSRFVSPEELDEMFPGASEKVGSLEEGSDETLFDADKAPLWTNKARKLRLVEHWYKHFGEWVYCIYVASTKLASGKSPFIDDRGRSISRYIVWCNQVDHDGDRYGFVRRLKGPQDAINQHRSKAMHIMNTRQVWARRGTFQDAELVRREAARPDAFIEYDGTREDWSIEQPAQEFLQQTQYFQDAKLEIENFGPSPALIESGAAAKSGRALAMLQQNGLAELGPFLGHYRSWKIRVYRAIWANIKKHWTAERWIRVTDDDELAQFVQVNALQIGPDGMPRIINQLGALDVDIILDEGPDTTNVMGDVFDTMLSLAQNKAPIPPQALIELSPLPKSQKDKILKIISQPPPGSEGPNPMELKAAEIQLQAEMKMKELQVNSELKREEMLMDQRLQQEKMLADQEMQRQKLAGDMAMERERCSASMAMEREKADTQTQLSLHKMRTEAEASREIEGAKYDPNGEIADIKEAVSQIVESVHEIKEAVEEIADEVGAEPQIIRDDTGRVAGVRRVGRSGRVSDMSVVRDERTGNIIGARRAPQSDEAA